MNVRDFQQKRRNRPIAVTDVAISKIRRIKFWGFDINQEEFIRKKHIELLKEVQKLAIEILEEDKKLEEQKNKKLKKAVKEKFKTRIEI